MKISSGYTVGADFGQIPTYTTATNVPVQVQSLTGSDLRMLDGLNIQGTMRKIYLNGNIEGVDRQAIKGGDLVVMPNLPNFPGPTTWLVTQVIEHWSDWSSVAIVLQNGG